MSAAIHCQAVRFGADSVVLKTSHGSAWVVNTAKQIPVELRERAFATRSKDFRYYELLEETLNEEKETDRKLTKLDEKINVEVKETQGESDEKEKSKSKSKSARA